jgi:hypothetical protein
MVHITFEGGYTIRSETKCWILSKPTTMRENVLGYYSNLNNAIVGLYEHNLRASSAKTIQTLILWHNSFINGLNKVLQPLDITISSKISDNELKNTKITTENINNIENKEQINNNS